MDVMTTARSMGLTSDTGDVFGTIEESAVIEHLLALGSAHPGHGELFAEAVARVQRSRSAGLERVTADSMFARDRANLEIQLRYRGDGRRVRGPGHRSGHRTGCGRGAGPHCLTVRGHFGGCVGNPARSSWAAVRE